MVEIIIDKREPKKIIDTLKVELNVKKNGKVDFKVRDEVIECGDYLLPDGYAIERKTGKDFVSSIKDGRLFTQLNNLVQYDNPVIAIITDNIWKDFYYDKNRHIFRVYIGTLSTIIAKYPKIKTVFFETDDEFVKFLISLHKKLTEDGHKERPAPLMRRPRSLKHRKENCLTAAKGVGVPMAKKLIKEFGSVNGVANASEADLLKIDKLGKQTAKNILEMLN